MRDSHSSEKGLVGFGDVVADPLERGRSMAVGAAERRMQRIVGSIVPAAADERVHHRAGIPVQVHQHGVGKHLSKCVEEVDQVNVRLGPVLANRLHVVARLAQESVDLGAIGEKGIEITEGPLGDEERVAVEPVVEAELVCAAGGARVIDDPREPSRGGARGRQKEGLLRQLAPVDRMDQHLVPPAAQILRQGVGAARPVAAAVGEVAVHGNVHRVVIEAEAGHVDRPERKPAAVGADQRMVGGIGDAVARRGGGDTLGRKAGLGGFRIVGPEFAEAPVVDEPALVAARVAVGGYPHDLDTGATEPPERA